MSNRFDEERLFPVRIFNKTGKLIRVIQVSKLKKIHWEKYEEENEKNKTGKNFILFDNRKEYLPEYYNPKNSRRLDLGGIYEGDKMGEGVRDGNPNPLWRVGEY